MQKQTLWRKFKLDWIMVSILAVLVVLLLVFQFSRHSYTQQFEAAVEQAPEVSATPAQLERLAQEVTASVIPRYHARNEAALKDALRDLNAGFDQYEKGIPAFIAEMTSIETQMHLLKGQVGDWFDRLWHDKDSQRVARYVQASFERNVFSEARLQKDIAGVLESLRYALEANQNQMVSEVRQVVLQSHLPVDVTQFSRAAYDRVMPGTWRAGFGQMGQQSLATVTAILAAEFGVGVVACRLHAYACIATFVISILATDDLLTFSLEKKLTETCHQIVSVARRAVIYDVAHGLQPRMTRELDSLLATNLQTTRKLITGR